MFYCIIARKGRVPMSIANDMKHHYKTIDKTCFTANVVYLFLHLLYLALFFVEKYYALVIVTSAVVMFYALSFLLIKNKKYYLYALLCGNVFFVFVSATTIMLGFNTGFHFFLIGLCVVSFFTSYFSKHKNIKGSIVWVGLSLIIYLVLYFVTAFNKSHYAVEKWLEITLFTINAIMVFAFILGYLVVFIRYALSLEKKIMDESRTDELTQISNRYALYDYFEQEEDKTNKALVLFDIDDFKNVNDVYGHVTGDRILKKVAEITNEALKDSFLCRYGGEEFVAVLDNLEENQAYNKIEELRKLIANQSFTLRDKEVKVTITAGMVIYQKDMALKKWVEAADEKMYIGKKSGKNVVIF